MDMAWIGKSAFLVIAGMLLLRIAGRKSISQMSVATTVIMISIGTTIVQPIAYNELWKAIGSAAIFIVSLLILEYLQLKFDWLENVLICTYQLHQARFHRGSIHMKSCMLRNLRSDSPAWPRYGHGFSDTVHVLTEPVTSDLLEHLNLTRCKLNEGITLLLGLATAVAKAFAADIVQFPTGDCMIIKK